MVSGSRLRSCSSRVGTGAASSPRRLIQRTGTPRATVGATSWKRLAATWTCRRGLTLLRSAKTRQCAGAGLYEPISEATTVSSTGTPICSSEAASRSESLFDRTARRQPRARSRPNAAGTSGNGVHPGSERRLERRQPQALRRCEAGKREIEHLAVHPRRILRLHGWLHLVVAVQEPRRSGRAEEPLELTADPAVPVDQRPIAVKSRPEVGHGASLRARGLEGEQLLAAQTSNNIIQKELAFLRNRSSTAFNSGR